MLFVQDTDEENTLLASKNYQSCTEKQKKNKYNNIV